MENTEEKPKISADGIAKRQKANNMKVSVTFFQNMRRNRCILPDQYREMRREGKTLSSKQAKKQNILAKNIYEYN